VTDEIVTLQCPTYPYTKQRFKKVLKNYIELHYQTCSKHHLPKTPKEPMNMSKTCAFGHREICLWKSMALPQLVSRHLLSSQLSSGSGSLITMAAGLGGCLRTKKLRDPQWTLKLWLFCQLIRMMIWWLVNSKNMGASFFVFFGSLFLAICYILEQTPVLCWILELNLPFALFVDCWSTTVLCLKSGIECYHSVGWFRVCLRLV